MLIHAHSGLRWVALILLVYAVLNAFLKRNANEFVKKDKMVNLFAMVTLHVQFLLGAVLLYTSGKTSFKSGWMKIDIFRFFGMEHSLGMLLAIVLVTIGYSKAKRTEDVKKKFKTTLMFYLIGLLLILAFIPWPFRMQLGAGWF